MKLARVFLMCVLGVAATMAAAQVYKWKDAEGKTHFSDVPPLPGQSKNDVETMRGGAVSSINTPKAPPIVSRSAEQASAAQASAVAAQAQKDPKVCQQAQTRKKFLQTGQMVKAVNDKGEVEFLSDERRQAEIADADKAIQTFCP